MAGELIPLILLNDNAAGAAAEEPAPFEEDDVEAVADEVAPTLTEAASDDANEEPPEAGRTHNCRRVA